MPWRCPGCGLTIEHIEASEPDPSRDYGCHVCRLNLRFDPDAKKLMAKVAEPQHHDERTDRQDAADHALRKDGMAHQLTDAEWDDLVDLITASPSERIDEALTSVVIAQRPGPRALPRRLSGGHQRTTAAWLVHLASISSGAAFDRALLRELRRLSVH